MTSGMPSGVEAIFAAALDHHLAGRLDEAERLYRQIAAIAPGRAVIPHQLGLIAHQCGRHQQAVDLIGQAIAIDGGIALYHSNLGAALQALGRLDEAVASLGAALVLQPDYPEAYNNLGNALLGLGRLDAAIDCFRRALALRPDYVDATYNLGNALGQQGRLDQAAACYRTVLQLIPDHARAHNNLGNTLLEMGRLDEAVSSFRHAARLQPGDAEAQINLGNALQARGGLEEAVTCYRRALVIRPDHAVAYCDLGTVLKRLGRQEEAHQAYATAITLAPDLAEARLHKAMSSLPIQVASAAEGEAAVEEFARALDDLAEWGKANPAALGEVVGGDYPFYLAYRRGNLRDLLSRFGDIAAAAAAARWRPDRGVASPWPRRERIRLAVVTGRIWRQSVWDVISRGIVQHLDRDRFELVLYHTDPRRDEETAWAEARADRFVQGPLPMAGWLERIDADRPDILFFPEVGMDPTTRILAALRLAPLQVASWGHPVTTGLPTIDLFLSGELLETADADAHYRETLIRLPGTGVCTERIPIPARAVDAGRLGLDDAPRFLLCQAPFKFDPADDDLYVRIAREVGRCRFWLSHEQPISWGSERVLQRLARAFRAGGLDPDAFLRPVPWLPRDQFFGLLDEMDVYLDCPAFSGYTTAWQAIHQGIPIVTLEGGFLRQRMAAGLLRQIGRPDTIAATDDEYVAKAVRLAAECRDPAQRAARRAANLEAARRADGNVAAVRALEGHLVRELGTRIG